MKFYETQLEALKAAIIEAKETLLEDYPDFKIEDAAFSINFYLSSYDFENDDDSDSKFGCEVAFCEDSDMTIYMSADDENNTLQKIWDLVEEELTDVIFNYDDDWSFIDGDDYYFSDYSSYQSLEDMKEMYKNNLGQLKEADLIERLEALEDENEHARYDIYTEIRKFSSEGNCWYPVGAVTRANLLELAKSENVVDIQD